MDRSQRHWRSQNPQMSVCLPLPVYEQVATLSHMHRFRSAAHLVRALLLKTLANVDRGLDLSTAVSMAASDVFNSPITVEMTPDDEAAPYRDRKVKKPKRTKATPAGELPPRTSPMLTNTDVYLDRTPLPALQQLPGIPAGPAHLLDPGEPLPE